MLRRVLTLVYGTFCYLAFLASFVYLLAFLANAPLPRTIDTGPAASWPIALAFNLGSILIFALQHSVMARPGFKEKWTRVIPRSIERSTYVLASVAALVVFFVAWHPMPDEIFRLEGAAAIAAHAVFGFGVLLVLISTFAIDHFELFGMRQVVESFLGRPLSKPRFRVSALHRRVRHPLYVGWILTFLATPTFTVGRLVLILGMVAYILIAIRYEERDLVAEHGEDYVRYRARTPMLVPRFTASAATSTQPSGVSGAIADS